MVIVEVYIGLISALLPTIIQVILVDHRFLTMIVTEKVDIGLIPENLLHTTMVD